MPQRGGYMRRRVTLLTSSGLAVIAMSAAAYAGETTVYTYDALGRLVASTVSGASSSATSAIGYDPAGNRASYQVTTGAGSTPTPSPTPIPTPTPAPTPAPSANQPPVATGDTVSMPCFTQRTVNLTANDTDPENNVPLVLLSISLVSGSANAIVSSASSVDLETAGKPGSVFSYTVRDSLGASSTGRLEVTVTGTVTTCNNGGTNAVAPTYPTEG